MGFKPSHLCSQDKRFSILGVSETHHFKTPGAISAHVTNPGTKFRAYLQFVQAPRAAFLTPSRPRAASGITVPVLAKVMVEGAAGVETAAQLEGEPEVEGSLVVLFLRSICVFPSPEVVSPSLSSFAVDRAGEVWQSSVAVHLPCCTIRITRSDCADVLITT
jgi:hypothetical protein